MSSLTPCQRRALAAIASDGRGVLVHNVKTGWYLITQHPICPDCIRVEMGQISVDVPPLTFINQEEYRTSLVGKLDVECMVAMEYLKFYRPCYYERQSLPIPPGVEYYRITRKARLELATMFAADKAEEAQMRAASTSVACVRNA